MPILVTERSYRPGGKRIDAKDLARRRCGKLAVDDLSFMGLDTIKYHRAGISSANEPTGCQKGQRPGGRSDWVVSAL
jgi:hypothetical protein